MIKAVLFDLDGVLTVDSTGSKSIIDYITKVTGVDVGTFTNAYRKHNYQLLYGHVTHTQIWGTICEEVGRQIDIQVLFDSFIHTPMDSDMLNLAMELKQKGYYIGLITDNKQDRVDYILSHHHLESLFDTVLISAALQSGKDKDLIFDEVIKKIPVQFEECVFIDNKDSNLIIPAKKGMSAIYYDDRLRDLSGLKSKLLALEVKL
ncbi:MULTISPECIES: HAD family hydrolase [unclassified Fusibacter]|uniref:HAD family hydrolase n=1 Tax=unclassified Fusibacter TaxID=2624464 RepID=UPI0010131349|nr:MULTISPECIES: HAD family hydrolase [unclassified Fusibacter]MCK8058866.1 HAD hydrolase-like protein [Fusibacter sp. A2]NPE21941.1 HAD hydrolase-like protein [Fusibacter sp. A1]RXV61509.1 haloacid dehalogenase [Fusibacter sp. A1]